MRTRICVTLPADRRQPGSLYLIINGMVALPAVPCLGKADNGMAAAHKNPARASIFPYGDTPTGSYRAVQAVEREDPHPRMGRLTIALLGIAGDARTAMINRTGLYIHGGPDLERYNTQLIPTLGCLRLKNPDMRMLVDKLGGPAPHGREVAIEIEQLPEEKPEKESV